MEGKSNRKRKKNEHWLPKELQRPHLEENTLTSHGLHAGTHFG
jgi:hypothetical protein